MKLTAGLKAYVNLGSGRKSKHQMVTNSQSQLFHFIDYLCLDQTSETFTVS